MKVTLINHSDVRGGASVVTMRLAEALARKGLDVTVLVVHKATDNPVVKQAAAAWRAKIPFYAEAARIFAANGGNRSDLFKVSLGSDGLPLAAHPEVTGADAVILAWVNQGMLALDDVRRIAALGKPLLWVMHDMWNLTALCHHAGECSRYTTPEGCCHCPLLHSRAAKNDMAAKVWRRKMELYRNTDIDFVAVSSWLADCCRKSGLFDGQRLHVIPNAFPTDSFYTEPRLPLDATGLPDKGKIILMGAARLDDPVKGLPYAVEALNKLADRGVTDALAVFFGNLRDKNALNGLRFPYRWIGPVTSPDILHELYARAHAVISTSLYETLPGTLVEGQAAGAVPVSFDRGGQADIISCPEHGCLVPFGDTDAFADALAGVLAQKNNTAALKAAAMRFSAGQIADRYISLITTRLRR